MSGLYLPWSLNSLIFLSLLPFEVFEKLPAFIYFYSLLFLALACQLMIVLTCLSSSVFLEIFLRKKKIILIATFNLLLSHIGLFFVLTTFFIVFYPDSLIWCLILYHK